MSRPTRVAAANRKNYVDDSENEMDGHMSDNSEDESFDEDEDPDKIEIPGGGSTLEDSLKLAGSMPIIKSETAPSSSRHLSNNVSYPTASAAHAASRKQELPSGSARINNLFADISLPEGTTIRPSNRPVPGAQRVFDTSSFLDQALNRPPTTDLSALANLQSFGQLFNLNTDNVDTIGSLGAGNSLFQFYSALLAAGNSALFNRSIAPPYGGPAQSWGMPPPKQPIKPAEVKQESQEEEDGQEDEVLGVAETYADYTPAKLKIGKSHPDPIVETASLSSVMPPEVYYQLHLPDKIIDKGYLSALQLESVVYSCQQHEFFLQSGERAGYLIGDGAGVGKGRTIAGVIYENYLCGRKKALWVSISADLKEDAERDLRDIGASSIPVAALNKLKYGKITFKEGVLFSTYSGLIGESNTAGKFGTRMKQILDWFGPDFDGLIVFDECHRAKNLHPSGATKPTKTALTVHKLQADMKKARVVYASATGASEPRHMAYMTRLGIWGPGTPFREFQDFINAVEKRGIGAMEIVAMDMKLRGAYIARQLSFKGVAFSIEEVPLPESFQKMYDEAVELWVEALNKFIEAAELMKADKTSKKSMWAQFWSAHQRFFKYLCIASKVDRACRIASEAIKDGKCVVIGLQSTGEARTAEQKEREGELDDFVSTAKGVLQNLIEKNFPAPDRNKIRRLLGISMIDGLFANEEPQASSSSSKAKPMRKAAQNAAKRARWNDSDHSDNENDSDFSEANAASESESEVTTDSKASESEFESVSSDMESEEEGGSRKRGRKGKGVPKKKDKKKAKDSKDVPSKEAVDKACQMRDDLLKKIEILGPKLPNNTLDQLIDELGGPEDVAEMTGRKMRLIQVESGKIEYQSRAESDVSLDQINLTEKQRFMDGIKKVAIISEAASSGISLQSDRRAKNKLRRVHITLELPWSADRAIQQFGRTHRSNQVNAPEYVFLISDLAGEHRFASIVAKRLESLGALTHGDRRATDTRDLSRFHIDSRFGKSALECCMKYIMYNVTQGLPIPPPQDYKGDFRNDVASGLVGVGLITKDDNYGFLGPDKDYTNMSKFLNRILGMPVALQNALFKFFTDILAALIANAKRQGRFDMGILNLDNNNGKTSLSNTQRFTKKHATGSGMIELHHVVVERGMSWEESQQKYKEMKKKDEGYYLANEMKGDKLVAVLIVRDDCSIYSKKDKTPVERFSVYRPSTGMQARRETLKEITSKYQKATPEETETHWNEQYELSKTTCIHAFWSGKCKNSIANPEVECDVGRRTRTYCVLSGSVLLCWDDVEQVLRRNKSHSHKMQIVRVQTGDGHKFVGLLIPSASVQILVNALRQAEQREKDAEELMITEIKIKEQENQEYFDEVEISE